MKWMSHAAAITAYSFNVDFGQGYLFGEPQPVREAI
jgi:EAL domain-containing protein (putative c-di-GMP-specific phosphodiesterase class I)